MPIVDFSTYTLNNDNAECWYILVFDCSLGNFVFRNPCDLIKDCDLNINDLVDRDTFDWCEMVNSPLINNFGGWALAHKLLRVNGAETCVERVTLSDIITPALFDYMVKVSASDPLPNYLEDSIVGVTNRTIVTTIPGQYVQIDVDPALILGIIPANPTCTDSTYNPTGYATLVYDNVLGKHRECNQNRADAYRHQRSLLSDITITTWMTGFPAGWVWTTDSCYWYVNTQLSDGMQWMAYNIPWSVAPLTFPAGTLIPGIRIEKAGIYAVWANIDFEITTDTLAEISSIEAIRFFVYSNNSKVMLLNMKEANQPESLCPAGVTIKTQTFSWYNQVYLNKWEYLFLWLRVYTPNSGLSFNLKIKSEALALSPPFPSNPAWKLSGTTFGCALVSLSIQDAIS